jgi:hypothetical protein
MTKMTLEQALAYPGELLAAWDHAGDETLVIYAIADGRLDRLAVQTMNQDERAAHSEELARRGVRVGATDGPSQFVWTKDGDFTIWSLTGVVACGRDGVITAGDREVARGDVSRVISFLDRDSLGHRGVKVLTRAGGDVVVVEEEDPAAALDPTYGMDNVMIDAAWATYLGRDLAAWLGVPHVDELP